MQNSGRSRDGVVPMAFVAEKVSGIVAESGLFRGVGAETEGSLAFVTSWKRDEGDQSIN